MLAPSSKRPISGSAALAPLKRSSAIACSPVAAGEKGQVLENTSVRRRYQSRGPVGFSCPKRSIRMRALPCACATQLPQPMQRPDATTSRGLKRPGPDVALGESLVKVGIGLTAIGVEPG
jgi:hypothetical protein